MGHRKQTPARLAILLFSFIILACTRLTKADAPSADYFSVQLGQEFEIKKGQTAGIAGTGLELNILRFFNQPCPPGAKCVWSGIGIEFEYRYDGQSKRGINLVRAFGYRTDVLRSDYESYAVLRITEEKDK